MKEYYIASGFKNVAPVRALKKILDDAGWEHTYDWTVQQGATLADTAADEMAAVYMADVVIVLLPGGRGTHVELGMAIGIADSVVRPRGAPQEPRIVIYSADPEAFSGTAGTVCAFYHHPLVERFTDMTAMINSLLGAS